MLWELWLNEVWFNAMDIFRTITGCLIALFIYFKFLRTDEF